MRHPSSLGALTLATLCLLGCSGPRASQSTEQVLALVRRLADNGLGVILISHNMNDVMQVADNVACLYLGRLAAQVSIKDVNHSSIVELITTGRSGEMGLQPEVAAAGGVA